MADAATTTTATTLNAKERRKLQREQDRIKAEADAAVAAASASASAAAAPIKDEPIKQEAAGESAAPTDGAPLNAKERRKLAREAERLQQEAVDAKAKAAAAAVKKNTVKKEVKPVVVKAEPASGSATAADVATTAANGEKLNAKQRRLLARKASRPEDEVADAKKKKKNTSGEESSKKRKRASKAAEGEGDATKKVKSIHLTLFVGQLPYNATEAKIRQHFHEAGEIQVRMLTDKRTKKFKGTAFIEVKDSKALGAALSRHHTLLNGRRINVEMTASGGGNKSEQRRTKIDLLRKKQSNVQVEKTKALIQKHIDSREYKLTKDDVDERMIDFLSWFDYETAKLALEEYNRCVSDRVQNRKAFFMGILKRFRETDGVE